MHGAGNAIVGRSALGGLLVALIAGGALSATHQSPRLALAAPRAIAAALADPGTRKGLAGTHRDHASVAAVDGRLDRVSFFAGGRIVAEAAVDRRGHVEQSTSFIRQAVPYGDWIAYQPALLVCLGALFVLTAGVAPLRRMRNLDVGMALSLLAPVVILQERYIGLSVIASLPGLAYLVARCGWIAFARPRRSAPCTSLLAALMPGWDAAQRVRMLRLVLVGLTLLFVMVGVSSPDAVDVVYAVMEGATKLIHGVLPYGHMPGDVVHGDTYPLLSYVLYAPLALISPVHSTWDSVDLALGAAVGAALAAALLVRVAVVARVRSLCAARSIEAEEAGLRAATVWLSFPPLLIAASSGTTDVALSAFLIGALVLWRRPALSTAVLAVAGWLKLAPFALLPVWLAPLRGRRLGAALAGVGLVSAALLLLLLSLGGIGGVRAMVHALSFQFSRGSPQSLWAVLGVGALQPVAEAALLGLIAASVIRLRADREMGGDPTRVASLAAAILIGLQLCADYWAFLYLVWVIPLLCVSMFATSASRVAEATATQPARVLLPGAPAR